MSTISQNNIVVNYVITSDQIAKTKTEFDKLTDAEKKAYEETKKLNDQLKKTGQEGGKSVKGVGSEMLNLSSIAKSGAGLLAGFFALSKIQAFAGQILDATIKFDTLRKAINFTSGSMEVGSANFVFLTKIADQLGISLDAASRGFKTISGAASQAGYTNKQVQDIFLNTSKAVAAFGLNSEEANGVFQALSQIISKGVVSMEELRQQLGERLPGVLAIAAQSVGKTTEEFVKLVSSGKITEREFIIPFTNALGLMSEKAAGIDSTGKAVTRFKNAYDQLLISLGRSADEEVGVIGFITKRATNFFNYWAEAFKTDLQKTEQLVGEGYQSVIDSDIAKNKEIEKADLILYKARTERNLKLNENEIKLSKFRLSLEKSLLEQAKNNQSILNIGSTKIYTDALKTVQVREEEIAQLEAISARITGQVKGYDELIKGKAATKAVTKALTDEELKALKEQYQARLKLLDLEEKIALIKAKIQFEDPLQLERESYIIKKKYTDLKIALDLDAAKSGIKEAKETAKVRQAEIELVAAEVIRANNEELKSLKDKNAKIEEENKDLADKRKADLEKQIREKKETDAELVKLEKEKADEIKKIDKKSADEKKKLEDDIKEITKQENEAIAYALGEVSDMITTRRLDNINREYNAMQRKYNEEVRLADGNVQKITELDEKRKAKEKELREKEFYAQRDNAIAQVIFKTAPIIAEYFATGVLAPAAIAALAVQTAQIGFILTQKVPEFAEGTKGKKYKGRAIVGEQGTEKVVTQSGRVYYTPAVATLAQFDEPVEIIPNHQLGLNDRKQLSLIYGNRGITSDSGGKIIEKLSNIEIGLKNMPVAAISLDERGFMKKVRTPNRSTTILNNRFKN